MIGRLAALAFAFAITFCLAAVADNSPAGVATVVAFNLGVPVGTATGTTEQTLATYTLPANSLDAVGRTIRITSCIKHAADADTVTHRIYFGTAVISDAGSATSGAVQCLFGLITKTGTNTQSAVFWGFKAAVTVAPVETDSTATDSATITIKGTVQDTTSAANDGIMKLFIVEYLD